MGRHRLFPSALRPGIGGAAGGVPSDALAIALASGASSLSLAALGACDPLTLLGSTDLTLWLKGNAGVTSGTPFTWADQSGNGRNFTNAANTPTTGTGVNGNATVKFNGTSSFLTNSSALSNFITATAWTEYCVLVCTDANAVVTNSWTNRGVICDTLSLWGHFVAQNKDLCYHWDGADKSARSNTTNGSAYVVRNMLSGGVLSSRVGTAGTVVSTSGVGTLTGLTGTMLLGKAATNGQAAIEIAALCTIKRAVTAAEDILLSQYFKNTYGVA